MMSVELLKWYKDMGADEVIDEKPLNRMEKLPAPLENIEHSLTATIMSPPTAVSPMPSTKKIISDNLQELIRQIEQQVAACNTLTELESMVRNFDGCALKKTASKTVFCDGNPNAKIMLIGEAPGANEDMQGIPFCGESGKLLDTMLETIGISRAKNLYITNSIFWRPPGNRKPTEEELAVCEPFVKRHIALVKPQLIILAGSTAVAAILHKQTPVSQMRQSFQQYTDSYNATTIPVAVLFHPSYLLRQPSQKRLVWQDLLKIKQYVAEHKIPL